MTAYHDVIHLCHTVTRKQPPEPEPPDPEKKERVLHTRVPERLETELRERAADLGISVSNLVRNVLGHAFGLVGDVVADSHAVARAARGGRPESARTVVAPSAAALDDVLAWQSVVLGKNALCTRCNAILPRGHDAAYGLGSHLVICLPCLEELRS